MNYADIKNPDVANGTGIRTSIFVSGCTHGCEGCFNKEAWDFNYGNEFTDDTMAFLLESIKEPYVQGLSVLGGEPLDINNRETVAKIIETVKENYPEKDIWLWSGYKFEEIKDWAKTDKSIDFILKNTDIIVDGEFELENKNLKINFRGSTNQRIIDVRKSLEQDEVIHWEEEITVSNEPVKEQNIKETDLEPEF